mmetsp:Transcript_8120/g.23161  ORF Transcript_8120/g.23161 Transcript_8120/m.23161 type:complete len:285 (-) Transcript_8120:915-1769(-)
MRQTPPTHQHTFAPITHTTIHTATHTYSPNLRNPPLVSRLSRPPSSSPSKSERLIRRRPAILHRVLVHGVPVLHAVVVPAAVPAQRAVARRARHLRLRAHDLVLEGVAVVRPVLAADLLEDLIGRLAEGLGHVRGEKGEGQEEHDGEGHEGPGLQIRVEEGEAHADDEVEEPVQLRPDAHGRGHVLSVEDLGREQPGDGAQADLEEGHVGEHAKQRDVLGHEPVQRERDEHGADEHAHAGPEDERAPAADIHEPQRHVRRQHIHKSRERRGHERVLDDAIEEHV